MNKDTWQRSVKTKKVMRGFYNADGSVKMEPGNDVPANSRKAYFGRQVCNSFTFARNAPEEQTEAELRIYADEINRRRAAGKQSRLSRRANRRDKGKVVRRQHRQRSQSRA